MKDFDPIASWNATVASRYVNHLRGDEEAAANFLAEYAAGGDALEFAIGSSLDLQKAYIPLAFLVAYQLEKTLGDQSETQHQLEAGVYYSGRPNLDLGVAFSTLLGENEYKQYLGQLRLNYVW